VTWVAHRQILAWPYPRQERAMVPKMSFVRAVRIIPVSGSSAQTRLPGYQKLDKLVEEHLVVHPTLAIDVP